MCNRILRRLLFFATITTAAVCAASVHLEKSGYQINVTVGGQPFTTYYFSPEVAKSYLMPLRTASGIVISRDFPIANDASHGDPKDSSFEPHQRPLYFAHGKINGLDFWGEAVFNHYYNDDTKHGYGHSVLVKVEEMRETLESGMVRATFGLQDPNGRVIGEETQAFTFSGDKTTRVIDCEFTLKATHGPIVMGDTKEGTFGIRLGRELSAPLGHMINSHGSEGEPAIWGKSADWVAYSGSYSGHAVGIAVFDHPASFRHPTTWHARGYGLLAANPFALREFTKAQRERMRATMGEKYPEPFGGALDTAPVLRARHGDSKQDGSWTIAKGKSLTFKYRVFIYEGTMTATQIAQEYGKYEAHQ